MNLREMIHASFIQIERDYRDNPGTQSPGKHNYIITDYNDLRHETTLVAWRDKNKKS